MQLRVVATAGHVDHGKSSLIKRMTGMDPDRWEEEKRRGLTIDLGYAWCTLPGGADIGFVDVPGHERFIANMLAGVGPVRLVMFVVAADEGWMPQSEEHLQILDLLGVGGGVIALTKRDLVSDEALAEATGSVRAKVEGTVLESSPIVTVSATTGEGMDELSSALAAMIDAAEIPVETRARLFLDRVFSIKGSGTVATGTLGGACISVGDEVEIYPKGTRARIRDLQTHKSRQDKACPIVRVAANLAGPDRRGLRRGDVLGYPGQWRPTSEFDAVIRPVRTATHAVTSRGAFKLHAGAAEVEVKLRFLDPSKLEPGGEAFVRIRSSRPLVLDVFDRFVIRDDGRRETVAGGQVLDVAPPARAGRDPGSRLRARAQAARDELPQLLTNERGAVRADDALLLTGSTAPAAVPVGDWFIREDVLSAVELEVLADLNRHHEAHPLDQGLSIAAVRKSLADALQRSSVARDPSLVDALLEELSRRGGIVRGIDHVRLPSHEAALDPGAEHVRELLAAVGGEHEATPPTVRELVDAGFDRDAIEAAVRAGVVARPTPELVFTAAFISRAEETVRESVAGITVSAFRERMGTTRKYALPILEWFDQRGLTRRDGDLRFPKGT